MPGGYANVFASLAERIGPKRLLLGKMVTDVEHHYEDVLVRCADGSEHQADFVIVTVSLGRLKGYHRTMFKPPLPVRRNTYIHRHY